MLRGIAYRKTLNSPRISHDTLTGMKQKLLIFDTHPIQYRAPIFKALYEKTGQIQVYFFNAAFDSRRWWFQEKGKHSKENFGLNLQEGYPQKILETGKLPFLAQWRLIKNLIKSEKPGAILIYGYYQPEHWFLRFWATHFKVPLLFVGETFDWRGSFFRKSIKRFLVNYFFKGVSGFISIGEKTAAYYQSWNVPHQKITQARYCTDTSPFVCSLERSQQIRAETRKNLSIPEKSFVLLFVGRIFDRKRPEDLLKIHEALAKKHSLSTLIVGQGELRETLQKKYPDPTIQWLGFKSHQELKNFYYAADLLVVPSEFETWGLVVNEAFSCARPALVTEDCGVCNDLLIPNINGACFPVGDLQRAIHIIEELIEDPKKLSQWGARAKEKVLRDYQPEQFAQSIIQAWKKLSLVEC